MHGCHSARPGRGGSERSSGLQQSECAQDAEPVARADPRGPAVLGLGGAVLVSHGIGAGPLSSSFICKAAAPGPCRCRIPPASW